MKKLLLKTMVLALFFITTTVFGQQTETSVKAKFLVEGGIEYGGDEILKVFFTNGGDQTMRAGQGGTIAVGGQFQFASIKSLMIRAAIGIKYNTTAADNANIRFTRLPINLMPYVIIKNDFRLGAGITTHQSIKFKGDDFFPDRDLGSALGARFEFGYKWIAATYTAINYKSIIGEKFSASSLGLNVSFTIPSK